MAKKNFSLVNGNIVKTRKGELGYVTGIGDMPVYVTFARNLKYADKYDENGKYTAKAPKADAPNPEHDIVAVYAGECKDLKTVRSIFGSASFDPAKIGYEECWAE